MEKIIEREVAWRIFAFEFNRSNLYVSEGDERAPNYIITPTGVKCNRLFIIGVATEVENIGKENNLWRARVADPTGVFTIYAGQYQPEAAIFLSELAVPAYVAVVGKARKYEPEEGSVYTSVRPEEMNTADEKLRDRWVIDTAEQTLERVAVVEDALKSGLHGDELKEFLQKKGASAVMADGAARAIQHYKNLDKIMTELRGALINALESVASVKAQEKAGAESAEKGTEPQISADERRYEEMPVEKPEEPGEIATVSEKTESLDIKKQTQEPKEVLATIIDKQDTGRGTTYDAVIEAASVEGISGEQVESAIKELMAEGRCYEPKIGVLRKV